MKSAKSSAPSPRVLQLAKRLLRLRWDRESQPPSSPRPKPDTSSDSEMLTPSEIEQLRQEQSAQIDLLQKEFPKAKIFR